MDSKYRQKVLPMGFGAKAKAGHRFTSQEVIQMGRDTFSDWVVRFGSSDDAFYCKAESIEKAIEMCKQSHPGKDVQSAGPVLGQWKPMFLADSDRYSNDGKAKEEYSVMISDGVTTDGQLHVDFKKAKSKVNHLGLIIEIDRDPLTDAEVPAVHLFKNQEQIGSLFATKNSVTWRTSSDGVQLKQHVPN